MNVAKTKCILIDSPYFVQEATELKLSVGGNQSEQVMEAKIRGIVLAGSLKWDSQVRLVINKIAKSMAMVRCCKKFMPYHIKKLIVKSLVMCYLGYCCGVWSATTGGNLQKLKVAQNRAG